MAASHRPTALLLACSVLVALAAALAAAPPGHATLPPAIVTIDGAADAAEIARIRFHFDSVLRELRHEPVHHLSPDQRAARARHIAELAAYRERGVFPHNHDFGDAWTPYFVDHRGVLCAVAHLLERSGRRDIVDRVAAANNNVWVADLATDGEFTGWLDASGLSLGEAARIQLPYVETPEEPGAGNRLNTSMAVVAGGLGAAAIVWNARADGTEHRRLRAALGLTAGALGVAVAASRMDTDGAPFALGVTTGAIGLTSVIVAAQSLLTSRPDAARAAVQPDATEPVSLSLAPSISARREGMAPGLTLNVRF